MLQLNFSVGTPTSEQRRDALALLKQEFIGLFTGKQTPLKWMGTRTQLFEMIYLVYVEDMILTDDGRPLSLTALASLTCLRFGERLTANPCAYIYKSRARKGTRSRTFFDSYCLYFCEGLAEPLRKFYLRIAA